MKPKYFLPNIAGRTALLASLIIVGFAAPSAQALVLKGSDTAGTSSFTSPLTGAAAGWVTTVGTGTGVAPVSGTNYFTGAFNLRTPANATSVTFPGDSLSVDTGGRFIFKNTGASTITVNNLILNGASTEIAISNGDTLSVTLAGNITVNAASTLSALGAPANNSGNFETLNITATINNTGSAGLTISGTPNGGTNTGVVKLSAANTYTGTVTVATPTNGFVASATNRLLQLNNLNALQNATLNLTSVANGVSFAASANTGVFNIGALSGSSNQVLADTANAPVRVNIGSNNASTTYSGILSGVGLLTKSGTGTLTLSGANTYTGPTIVNAGTLSLGSAYLKDTAKVTIASGAFLNLTHGATDVVGSLVIDGVAQADGVYGPVGSGAPNPTSAITGTGFIQVVTPPSQNISLATNDAVGTSSFNSDLNWSDLTAPSAINNYFTGAFVLRTSIVAGSYTFAGGSLSVDTGGRLIGKGASLDTVQNITVNNLILNGGLLLQAQLNTDNAVMNLAGAINVNAASTIGAFGSVINDSNFETLDIASTISGAGALAVAGTANGSANSGLVKLSAANPYSGNITVAQPASIASATNRLLQLNNLDAVTNATLTLGTGTTPNVLSFATGVNTGTFNVGALAGTANLPLSDTAGLPVALSVGGNNASASYTGALSGAGTLTKVGSGTQTLGGVNTHTGATNVNAGTLVFTNSSQSIGSLTVANAATAGIKLATAETTVLTTTDLTFGTTGPTTVAFDFSNLDTTVAPLATTGAFTANGTLNFTFANSAFLTTGTHPLVAYPPSSFTGSIPAGSFTLGPRSNGTLANDTANGLLSLNVTADVPKWTGADNFNWVVGPTGSNKNWKLVNADTATDYISSDIVLFDDTPTATQTVDISAANVTPTGVTFNTTEGYTLVGAFGIAGATPLIKDGSGTLTIKNTNTFTGATTINDGTLQLGDGVTDGSIAATPNIVNNGTLVYNRVGSFTYGGVISGFGALVKSGPGTQVLTAANTYSGTTTVTGGLLSNGITNALRSSTELTVSGGTYDLAGFDQTVASLSDGGSSSGTVTNSGALKQLTLNSGSETTFAGEISGALRLRIQGGGKLTLPDSNSYAGTTFVVSGTLAIGSDSAIGTGTLDFGGGTIESVDNTARTITNPLNFSASSSFGGTGNLTFTASPTPNGTDKTLTVTNPRTEFSGVLAGPSGRTKEGDGLLVFSGLNTYSGATTINAGILRITNPVLSNTAAVVISGTGVLDLPYTTADQVGSLTLDGVVQSNGVYGAIGSGASHETAFITGTGFLQVGPPGFSTFMDGFTSLTTAQKLPGADPDNDGFSNLVEYALAGFDPTVADASPGTFAGGVLSFTKRAAAVSSGDIVYAIEASTTLDIGSWALVTPSVNDATTISYTLPTGLAKEFARLRIVQY